MIVITKSTEELKRLEQYYWEQMLSFKSIISKRGCRVIIGKGRTSHERTYVQARERFDRIVTELLRRKGIKR